MKDETNRFHLEFTKPAKYRIVVKGKISLTVLESLNGLQQEVGENYEQGNTSLIGVIPDQSALTGILNAFHNWQIPVISVNLISK